MRILDRLGNLLPFAAMVVAYCFMLDFLMDSLPYAWLPLPWIETFGNRRSAVAAWFALLNILGAIVSAVPVVSFLWWIAPVRITRNALLCGGITAVVVLVRIVSFAGGAPKVSPALTAMILRDTIVEVLAVALAPVALVRLLRALRFGAAPSKMESSELP